MRSKAALMREYNDLLRFADLDRWIDKYLLGHTPPTAPTVRPWLITDFEHRS